MTQASIDHAAAKPNSVAGIIGLVVDAVPVTRRMVRPPHHGRNRQGRSVARTHPAFRGAPTRVTEPVERAVSVGYEYLQVLAVRSFGNWKPIRLASEHTHCRISAARSADARPSRGNLAIFAASLYLDCGTPDLSIDICHISVTECCAAHQRTAKGRSHRPIRIDESFDMSRTQGLRNAGIKSNHKTDKRVSL
jgi:hypothetical protein